jgi:hypothetical protein
VCLAGNNKAYEDANNENQADNEKAGHRFSFYSLFKLGNMYARGMNQVKPKNWKRWVRAIAPAFQHRPVFG